MSENEMGNHHQPQEVHKVLHPLQHNIWYCRIYDSPFVLTWGGSNPICTVCGWLDRDAHFDGKDFYFSAGFLNAHDQRAVVGSAGIRIFNPEENIFFGPSLPE